MVTAWRNLKNIFSRPLLTIIFRYRFHFEGKNNAWISQVRRVKWSFFIETGLDGSDRNLKSWFFLLGLKYTLRTYFKYKNFLSNSRPRLRNNVRQFSTFWHLVVQFGHMNEANFQNTIFPFWWNKHIIILSIFTFFFQFSFGCLLHL